MLFPVAGAVQFAVGCFSVDVSVRDQAYLPSDGQDQPTPIGTRVIRGAVDPSRSKQMEYLFRGSLSDGDIGIYTSAPLYYTDQYQVGAGYQRQSFVTWAGIEYRISDAAEWVTQAGIRVYLGKRHVEQGVG